MIRMNSATYNAIRKHGEETYPHECCGILLGRNEDGDNQVEEAIRAGNTRTDSAHNRYHIAPQELIKAQRTGRERGLDIVGFYHSHPDHPAMWSQTDLAEAHWMNCSYIITSVEKGVAAKTNSFLLLGVGEEDKRLEIEPIALEDAASASTQPPSIARC